MPKKNLSTVATLMGDVDFPEIKNHVNALRTDLPFLQSFSDEALSAMNKISDSDKTYIADCLIEAASAQDLLPPYFSVEDIRKDDVLNNNLYELEDMLFDLYQDVKRNRMAAADRAYSGVSTFYGLVKSAADANVPKAIAIYKRLQEYHKKKVDAGKTRRKKESIVKQAAMSEKLLQTASTN
jgi:hypothetical protein